MLKISRVEAYQGMNEIDFIVMEDELYTCFNSDQRGNRKQSHEFYLIDETTFILEIYWDDEKVHTVSFENKAELTESGKEKLNKEKLKGECKMENKNYYELDKALCFAKEAAEQLESAEWYASDLLETVGTAKLHGMDSIPAEEVLNKVRGIFYLLHNGILDLNKNLDNAHEVSEQLNGFETEKKA